MSTPTAPQPPAAILATITTLAAMPPATLSRALDTFSTIEALAKSLPGDFSDLGAKITGVAKAAYFGEDRVRTLPQANERLAAIVALIPSDASVTPAAAPESNETRIAAVRADFRSKMRARGAADLAKAETLPPAANTDAAIYANYERLTGSARQAFFSEHRAELVREHTRRANALTPEQAAVVAEYQAMAPGQARRDFLAANETAIWSAFRSQRRAR